MPSATQGIGILLGVIIMHVALSLASYIFASNLSDEYNQTNTQCQTLAYRDANKQLCNIPNWAHETPLEPLVSAIPDNESWGFAETVLLAPKAMMTIFRLLWPNYPILENTDPFLAIFVLIVKVASSVAIMTIIFAAGKALGQTLLGWIGLPR